jgi:membrane protease YdiL (CAAX protease family)
LTLAEKLRGFGPLGAFAALIVLAFGPVLEPFNSIPFLAWVHYSQTPWSEVGLARPRNWIATAAAGIGFGVALKIAMKSIVMPLLGTPAFNQEYHYLVGNGAARPGILVVATVGAGFGEEVVFRGFLFERLGKLFGSGPAATSAIVLSTSLLFGAIHYPLHGIHSAEQAAINGLVFGTYFAITRRLWVPIFAHAAFDVTAIFIIYFDVESRVAHLVFQ